jgi:hypothetical protein
LYKGFPPQINTGKIWAPGSAALICAILCASVAKEKEFRTNKILPLTAT